MSNKAKVGIIVSHPIQHFCPQYVSFSKIPNVEVKLFFASMLGYKKYIDKNFGQEVIWNNLRLDEFEHEFLNGDKVLPSNPALDAPSLESALAAFQPDILITYGYFHKVQKRAHKWANKHEVKLAYISDAENRQRRSIWNKIARYAFLNWYFKRIDFFLSVGEANEAYYKKYGVTDRKIIRMHYPIDLKLYEQAYLNRDELNNSLRNKLGIDSNDFVISVVGKLVEWKNQDHLIDVISWLEKRGRKVTALIIGSGQMQSEWQEKAKSLKTGKVIFTGFVDPMDLPAYYAASDIYVHPASIEPHSLAISEAIFMGCPVIISDTCGSYGETDDVQVNKNGFVYSFGNIPDLADKIIRLQDDHALCQRFSKHSHAISVHFQERAHGQSLIDLIKASKES